MILAGGESRRFGAPKALAPLGGRPLLEWVAGALRSAVPRVGLIANRPELFADSGLPTRPDRVRGAGALGGIHAALRWAREEGLPGILCAPCDAPFLPAGLLRRIAEEGVETGARAVVPESGGRRGIEPLCAYYGVDALSQVELHLRQNEHAVRALVRSLDARTVPREEVARWGAPEVLFLNVNTPGEYRRAQEVLGAAF